MTVEPVIPESTNPPAKVIDEIRIADLFPPKNVTIKNYGDKPRPIYGRDLEIWCDGYRSALQFCLKLLESSH